MLCHFKNTFQYRAAMVSIIRFAFLFSIILEICQSERYSLRNIRNFVVQLRNDSDSMAEYAAKIQAIFCPEQPICGALLSDSKQNIINSMPASVTVDNKTVMIDELKSFVRICCFPCSCEDTCKYDNNCCLTKTFDHNTFNDKLTSSKKSECIASSSKSYKNKRVSGFAKYFMTTQCFSDTNASVKAKCETPNPYDLTDTIPVTSLSSGHTYWNKHCALCNNDSKSFVFWDMAVVFWGQFVFYRSAFGIYAFPDTKEEFYNQLLDYEEIFYIPPFEMQQKRCAPRHVQRTCTESRNDTREADYKFLYETCNMFVSPTAVGAMNFIIDKNIFCYFCNEEIAILAAYQCSFSDDIKHLNGDIIGLINYNDAKEISSSLKVHGNGKCSCMEIFDTYQKTEQNMKHNGHLLFSDHIAEENIHTDITTCITEEPHQKYYIGTEKCRPLYCPPWSLFSAGCRCTEIMTAVSGMPVLLKLKVTAEPGSLYPATDVLAAQFRKALQKAIKKFIGHVSVEIHASFRPRNVTNTYYLYVAIIRSEVGYDTKETIKPLLAYLDADIFLKVKSNGNKFSVGLVSEILFNSTNDQIRSALDPKSQIDFDFEFSAAKRGFTTHDLYQELSPLLFCKQVELNKSEFTERHGQIIINITSMVLSVSDFFLTAEMQARLCADQYLSRPLLSFGNTNDFVMVSLIVLCFCIPLALWKTRN